MLVDLEVLKVRKVRLVLQHQKVKKESKVLVVVMDLMVQMVTKDKKVRQDQILHLSHQVV